ncbi:MAG: hypothetical protein M1837_001438 [Sclerophora amabilis]|nr:MAG: hypothetical protein M1837_001438 [Sclerophora amabilis]
MICYGPKYALFAILVSTYFTLSACGPFPTPTRPEKDQLGVERRNLERDNSPRKQDVFPRSPLPIQGSQPPHLFERQNSVDDWEESESPEREGLTNQEQFEREQAEREQDRTSTTSADRTTTTFGARTSTTSRARTSTTSGAGTSTTSGGRTSPTDVDSNSNGNGNVNGNENLAEEAEVAELLGKSSPTTPGNENANGNRNLNMDELRAELTQLRVNYAGSLEIMNRIIAMIPTTSGVRTSPTPENENSNWNANLDDQTEKLEPPEDRTSTPSENENFNEQTQDEQLSRNQILNKQTGEPEIAEGSFNQQTGEWEPSRDSTSTISSVRTSPTTVDGNGNSNGNRNPTEDDEGWTQSGNTQSTTNKNQVTGGENPNKELEDPQSWSAKSFKQREEASPEEIRKQDEEELLQQADGDAAKQEELGSSS